MSNVTVTASGVKSKHKMSVADNENEDDAPKKCKVGTRKTSSMPKCDKRGIIKDVCFFFVGKNGGKKLGKDEPLVPACTTGAFDRLEERAKVTKKQRVKQLVQSGIDLVAKEAHYHKSCRTTFNNETRNFERQREDLPNHFHKKAFACVNAFIKSEVIRK